MAMPGNRKSNIRRLFFAVLLAAACLPNLGHAACGITKTVQQAGGGDFTNVSAAVALAQSSSPLATDWCINIDSAVYSEQVTVQNIAFTYSTNTLTLQTDPTLLSTQATITPPAGSTAAFQIVNSSVNVFNIGVAPTSSILYGISVSSNNVTISSVSVIDGGGKIGTAGIAFLSSSYSSIFASSITAQSADGIDIVGSFNTLSRSTITGGSGSNALNLSSASSNTVTQCYLTNPSGRGLRIVGPSAYNTISQSTITNNSGNDALVITGAGARFNRVAQSYISNSGGHALSLDPGNDNNTITLSTITSPVSIALLIKVSSSDIITSCYIQGSTAVYVTGSTGTVIDSSVLVATGAAGSALWMWGASVLNTISRSTMTSNSVFASLYLNGASSNTITQSYVSNTNSNAASIGVAAFLDSGSNYNTITLSTITSSNVNNGVVAPALNFTGASNNTVAQSYVYNPNNPGNRAIFFSGSNYNTISFSTVTNNDNNNSSVYADASSSNTITQSYVGSPNYMAVTLNNSNYNSITWSTMTSNSALYPHNMFTIRVRNNSSYNVISRCDIINPRNIGVSFAGAAGNPSNFNTVSFSTVTSGSDPGVVIAAYTSGSVITNSYVQGSTGVFVSGSTGTVIDGSVLVATGSAGNALWLTGAGVNLNLTTNTFTGGPLGAGIFMDPGNYGAIVLTSNTILGGSWGVYISTMNCAGTCSGANLSISSMIFSGGLTAGATAIHFAGGTFVSTFTNVQFADSNIAVNVNGAPLSYGGGGSRITMSGYAGAKAGPSFEDDPNSVIDWATGGNVPPTTPIISQVFITSVTVSYGSVGASAYEVDASTALDFSGTLFPAVDLTGSLINLSPMGLSPNATYYLRAGALWSGTTFYANTTPSFTVTLASTPFPLSFSAIGANQFTVNWPGYTNPAGTVYTVDISTDISYSLIAASASTTGLTASFLGLQSQVAYYVRVRAFNSAGVPSPYALGAVFTAAGVITLSANFSTQTWYNSNGAFFNAQGPAGVTRYYYRISTSAADVATLTDPWFSGASLGVVMPQGLYYFHVLGADSASPPFTIQFGTASYGAVHIDTGAPVIVALTAQTSSSDPSVIANGGSTLSPIPRFMWTSAAAVPQDPIQGYSYAISAGSSMTPTTFVTTTLGFWDAAPALTVSGVYYFSVRALNLAGTWGNPVSMNFSFTTIPSVDRIIVKNNYFNPLRGGFMQVVAQTASGGHVKVDLYTIMGQRVLNLADGDVPAGNYTYTWYGKNQANEIVGAGLYLLHVEAPNQKKDFKVILVK